MKPDVLVIEEIGYLHHAADAANVLYGALSQSDHLSATVFAETARKQMTVVKSPMELPPGAVLRGRMAFRC